LTDYSQKYEAVDAIVLTVGVWSVVRPPSARAIGGAQLTSIASTAVKLLSFTYLRTATVVWFTDVATAATVRWNGQVRL